MKRLVILLPVLLALQVGVQPALAWTWPVDGPVLRPFILGDDPYAAGQHRGIDIGASSGATVVAPASGTVSFAGTVPGGGKTLTIRTADGYSVTLLHLGTIAALRGGAVAEGHGVGTVGPSGDAELPRPYVYLGIRTTADRNGYLDPLSLLPPAVAAPAPQPEPAPEPARVGQAPAPPATSPASETAPGPASGEHPAADAPSPAAQPAPAAVGHAKVDDRRGTAFHPPLERPAIVASATGRRAAPDRPAALSRAGSDLEALPARKTLRSFEPGSSFGGPIAATNSPARSLSWALLALCLSAAGAVALDLRRQVCLAGAADGPAAKLLERALASAEDTRGRRLREEERFVLDGDLERVLLAQAEALPSLDRDDDPPELVDVSDDPRPRHSPRRAACRPHRVFRTPCLGVSYPSIRLLA